MWCGARDGCTFEMIEGMAVFGATGGNPSGSRPNFFGRQHLTFDKGGKCGGAKQGIVQKISLMVGMGSDHHHSWLGLTVQQNLTLLNVRE